jgi:hypothetical protein
MACQRHGFGFVVKHADSFRMLIGVESIHEPSADVDDTIVTICLHPIVERVRVPAPDLIEECLPQAPGKHVVQAVEDLEDGGVG